MTTTVIASDIHLGARNSQAAALLALLHSDFDRLILNGDTIDDLNFERFRPVHWEVLDRLRVIARRRELVLIRGNHDGGPAADGTELGPVDVLAHVLGVELCESYSLWAGRRRYLVLHGDQFDRTLNLTWIGDAADSCYRALQCCSRPAARWVKGRVKHWCGVVRSVKHGAVQYAREQHCAGIITGHTHYHDDDWAEGVHYLNTGCWVDWPCTYVRIDGSAVRVCRWTDASRLVSAMRDSLAMSMKICVRSEERRVHSRCYRPLWACLREIRETFDPTSLMPLSLR